MSTVNLGFDEKEYMVKIHTGSEQEMYHTKMFDKDVHEISTSSAYAADRIICDQDYELGEKIFKRVIDLQDKNPQSKTYGLWPWYAEELIEDMDMPDYNMAGFNAKEMIVSLFAARDNLSQDIYNQMLECIERACECIIRRNVGPGYTNVCITDCFITVAAGELTGKQRFLEYGRKKLKKFICYVKGRGEIAEYNSPTYSILTINDVGDFLKYITDKEALEYANEINEMLWTMIAEHFDYNTLQLNGPQERAYADFAGIRLIKTIAIGCDIDMSAHIKFKQYFTNDQIERYNKAERINPKCPENLIPYFKGEKEFGYVTKFITDGYNFPFFEFPKVATTYKGNGYSIGTYNKSELWNQRRPFLAYIYNNEKDISFRVKCYHDGFDFSSGAFHAVQHKSNVLASVNFSENRGDTHVNADMISDGFVEAEEIKVTFEFCGDVTKIKHKKDKGMMIVEINDVKLRIVPFIKEFGNIGILETVDVLENKFQYNLIFYRGDRKIINLCEAKKAFTAFTVEFEPKEEYANPTIKDNGDITEIYWKPDDTELGLWAPNRTLPFIKNMSEDMQLLDGKNQLDVVYNDNQLMN